MNLQSFNGNKMVEVESAVWSIAIAKMIFLVNVTNYDIVYRNELLSLDEIKIAKPHFSCLSKYIYVRFMWVIYHQILTLLQQSHLRTSSLFCSHLNQTIA